MSGPTPSTIASLLHSQLAYHPPVPTSSFSGQTIIVTGANAGLGREAVKHFVRLGAKKVILGVRDISKGEAATAYVEHESGRQGCMEVWKLDMADSESVKSFAKRAGSLERLDVLVANAGVWATKFEIAEDYEMTITVNVISTFLLARLLVPKLEETAFKTAATTRITILTSTLHKFAKLPARKARGRIFDQLKEPILDFDGRYNDSKLLVMLYGQKLVATLSSHVAINMVCPGYCLSNLVTPKSVAEKMAQRVMARSSDEGARIIVDAVAAEKANGRRGAFVSDMKVKNSAAWIETSDGKNTAERVWVELNEILKSRAPELSKRPTIS